MEQINNQYKDRLFKFIFGRKEHKDWTLSLYNAINGSNYKEEKDIQITTIDNVVYLSMKNDVSFLLDTAGTMNFCEQQSTYDPNMPVRFLMYAGMVYSRCLGRSVFSIYTSKLRELSIPKCVCFYNSKSKKEDEVYLNLSDAYKHRGAEADISVRVRMINLNYGHSKELLDKCRPLSEYSFFVDSIRNFFREGSTMEEAVSMSIDKLSADSILKPFLMANREDVCRMILTEYNEEKFAEAMREEEKAEERKK